MRQDEIIEEIESKGNMFEVAEVTTFRGFRRIGSGQIEVEITLEDHGVDGGEARYFVTAHRVDEPGVRATGNGGPTISYALGALHWYDLDAEAQ